MSLVSNDVTQVNRRAFFDDEVFKEESEKVFTKTWQFLAHESEIPAPGDYVTRTLAGDAVIVARGEDGEVRVFRNACRHRGAQLCGADQGNTSHFRCSYHAWTYSNTGGLRGVPMKPALYGKDFDRANWGLVSPPHVDSFCGLIFANWDPDAVSLQESLGSMAWYLKMVFGKCEYEVVGPPARLRGEQNWKSGAENFTGDGYHIPAAHHTTLEFGVLTPERIFEYEGRAGRVAAPDPEHEKFQMIELTADVGGHAGLIQKLPVRFEKPNFLGYEQHVFPEIHERLDRDQVELLDCMFTFVGNVFPNFSFIEQAFPFQGDETPPVAVLHMRVWLPVAPDRTEVVFFALVPKSASKEWKLASQTAFTRTFGVGGCLETDDYQNWTGMTQVNSGPAGRSEIHDYAGSAHDLPITEKPWPGNVYLSPLTDVTFRAMYREWARLMGDGADTNGSDTSESVQAMPEQAVR